MNILTFTFKIVFSLLLFIACNKNLERNNVIAAKTPIVKQSFKFENLFSYFKKSLNNKNQIDQILYDTLIYGNVRVIRPSNIDVRFKEILESDYKKSLKEMNCGEEGEIELNYIVQFYYDSLISIKKNTYLFNCGFPSDVFYEDGLNFINYKNKIYSINFNERFKIDPLLRMKLLKIYEDDADCKDLVLNMGRINKEFIFNKSGFIIFINPINDKVCNSNIELPIDEKYIAFKQ